MAENTSQLNILVKVRDEASAALRSLSNDVSDLGGSLNFAGGKAGILAGALAAIGAGAILNKAISAFADAEFKMAQFDAIVKNLPVDLQQFRQAMIDAGNTAQSKFGFDNETATLSIARLMAATKDAPFAFQAFQAAMDLARAKNIDLETAVQSLIRAFQGGGRLLKQFGIEIDEHASKETILAAILQQVGGTAEATSGTLKVLMETLRNMMGDVTEEIGKTLAPTISFAIEKVKAITEAFGGWEMTLKILRPILLALAIFLAGVFVVSMGAAIASVSAMIGIGGALIAKIALIALVLAAFISVWQIGWEQIKALFQIAWIGIQNIFNNIWGAIRNSFQVGIDFIRSQLQSLVDFFNFVVNLVTQPIKKASEGISNTLERAIGAVRGIFGFQHGGIVTRPTIGLLGEAGPEAVIPLSRLGGAGIGGGTIQVFIQGDVYTTREIAEEFAREIATNINYQLKL